MRQYLRVAGYTFLALCGLYAWLTIETGWRHYAGLAMFFLASVRVFILIKPGQQAERDRKEEAGKSH